MKNEVECLRRQKETEQQMWMCFFPSADEAEIELGIAEKPAS